MDEAQEQSQHLTDPDDIHRVLNALLISRSLITVALPGTRLLSASMVIAIERDSNYWLIDALSEPEIQRELANGQRLIVRAAYGGIQVSCDAQLQAINASDTGPLLQLSLPSKVLHRQRRAAYRADIAAQDRPVVSLQSSKRGAPLEGVVFDISAEGAGVLFDRFVRPPIEPGELFTCPQIHPELPEQTWTLIAKHPQYDRQTDKYRCGFSFRGLTAADTKRLGQWVLGVQRAQRVGRRKPVE